MPWMDIGFLPSQEEHMLALGYQLPENDEVMLDQIYFSSTLHSDITALWQSPVSKTYINAGNTDDRPDVFLQNVCEEFLRSNGKWLVLASPDTFFRPELLPSMYVNYDYTTLQVEIASNIFCCHTSVNGQDESEVVLLSECREGNRGRPLIDAGILLSRGFVSILANIFLLYIVRKFQRFLLLSFTCKVMKIQPLLRDRALSAAGGVKEGAESILANVLVKWGVDCRSEPFLNSCSPEQLKSHGGRVAVGASFKVHEEREVHDIINKNGGLQPRRGPQMAGDHFHEDGIF